MVAAIVFDMDGVLIDSEDVVMAAEQDALQETGIDISTDELAAFHGMASHDIFETVCARRDVDADVDALMERKVAHYLERMADVSVIDGAIDAVQSLSERYPVAIASNTERPIVERVVDHLGLTSTVTVVVSVDDVDRGKPAPDLFELAAAEMGADVHETVVLEDSPAGVDGANAAGCITVGFTGGFWGRSLRRRYDGRLILCVSRVRPGPGTVAGSPPSNTSYTSAREWLA